MAAYHQMFLMMFHIIVFWVDYEIRFTETLFEKACQVGWIIALTFHLSSQPTSPVPPHSTSDYEKNELKWFEYKKVITYCRLNRLTSTAVKFSFEIQLSQKSTNLY